MTKAELAHALELELGGQANIHIVAEAQAGGGAGVGANCKTAAPSRKLLADRSRGANAERDR